jgi:aldehyde:ferredoxin oxidoreductase
MRTPTVLNADLHSKCFKRSPLSREWTRQFIGGRGVNMAHLYQTLQADIPALDPRTPLLFAAGPLVGTSFPGGARFNVSGRSPQTSILGDSNAGGFFGPELRFAGIDQLALTGRADRPSILWIDDEEAQLIEAGDIWGMDTVEATAAIQERLGDSDLQIAVIGPAAENGVSFSGVFANLARAAARTGMGTLMASKNLKAVAIRGTQGVSVHHPKHFHGAIERLQQNVLSHPSYEIRTRLGTTQMVMILQNMGGLPGNHYQTTTFENAEAVSGQAIEVAYKQRSKGCFACTIPCSRYLVIDDDRFPGLQLEGPEYEPLAGFSVRIGSDDLPLALHAVDRCNRLGMDAISVSEAIAWAMECSERNLLPVSQRDGLDLRFGNGDAALALIEKIAQRDGLGDILADGVRAAATRLGIGESLAMEVKGLELFQADPRAMKGYGLGNAVASRGADHLRSEPWFEFSGDREEGIRRYGTADSSDRLAWRGKGRLVKDFEEKAAIADALGVCKNTYNNMEVLDWDETAELLAAATGDTWTGESVRMAGERIVNVERLINARLGIDRRHDTLPKRFLEEPAGPADSPSAGSIVELESMLDEYYTARGWDLATGLPTEDKLNELGLGD